MVVALLVIGVVALLFGPQLWVNSVLRRYSTIRDDYPGTGGEFARHLLLRTGLSDVRVEEAPSGDHYDPLRKAVCLTADKLNERSLTAVAVAAHEVGHAIQDAAGYRPLHLRQQLVRFAQAAQYLGNLLIIAIPLIAVLSRAPSAGLLFLVAGLASFGSAALVHLLTLPVELDASFRRALPLLQAGGYLRQADLRGARHILGAAAFTYVAASLASLLNLWRWLRLLRR
jgi:Zn-dependent membrane protease YugP